MRTQIRSGGASIPLTKDSEGNDAGSVVFKDAATTKTRHNRYLDLGATASTWPGDDTFSVTFTEAEAVTRYRVLLRGATASSYVKVTEDAVNEAQADAWLTTATSSATADVNYIMVENSLTTSATTIQTAGWSEWQEFPEGYSLARLDFLGSSADSRFIWVEAE